MADDLKNRPIIIKRKKVVGGDGHHGGAWKVAYADFVTAMMAFFMLMWLLNATTEQQRKGIADYFSPNVPIARISGGGEGAFGGESPFSELSVAQNGTGAINRRPTEGRQSLGASGTNFEDQPMGDQHMQAANQFLEAAAAQDAVLAQALALQGDGSHGRVKQRPAPLCLLAPIDLRRPLYRGGGGSKNQTCPRICPHS